LRFLEGEVVQYRGVAYIVKGYQHPEGFLVAYPRYSLLTRTPLRHMALSYITEYEYWDCVKHKVPLVPLEKIQLLATKLEDYVLSAVRTLIYMLNVSENRVYVTGSSLILGDSNDVDVVLYGVDNSFVETLRSLVEKGLLKRSDHLLVSEYMRKHSSNFALHEYLALKKNTLLHLTLGDLHINLKLLKLERGHQSCVDPVYEYSYYTGLVEILRPLNPHILPARYSANYRGKEVLVESLRELYAELTPGVYYAEGARLEVRKNGLYLVPDHGVLKPVRI